MPKSKKTPAKHQLPGWLGHLRTPTVALLIVVSGFFFTGFVLVHWVEKQILNTDNWVTLVGPLPKQPVVSTALGNYVGKQIFPADTVKAELTDALPPKAAFLASPLTSQLQTLTTKTAQKVVSSDGFQTVWSGANRLAMSRLLAKARGQPTELQSKLKQKFNLNLSGVDGQLAPALGSLASAIPALQPQSQNVINVATDLHSSAEKVRQVVRDIDFASVVLPLWVAASLLWALALAKNRRRATLAAAIVFLVLMLLELIAIKGIKEAVLNQVHDSSNLQAVGYIYDTLVGWLRHMIITVIVILAAILLVSLFSGPSRLALAFRRLIRIEKWHLDQPLGWWHSLRTWVARYQYWLWLGALLVVLAGAAAFVTISARSITNSLLLLACIFAVVRILVTPRPKLTGKAK